MRRLTGKEALEDIAGYANRTRRQGESEQEALARACSERPDLYANADAALRREARTAPHPLEPEPQAAPMTASEEAAEDEIMSIAQRLNPVDPESERGAATDIFYTRNPRAYAEHHQEWLAEQRRKS